MPAKNRERQAKFRKLLLENKRKLWNELREELFRKTGEELHTQFEIPQDPVGGGSAGIRKPAAEPEIAQAICLGDRRQAGDPACSVVGLNGDFAPIPLHPSPLHPSPIFHLLDITHR